MAQSVRGSCLGHPTEGWQGCNLRIHARNLGHPSMAPSLPLRGCLSNSSSHFEGEKQFFNKHNFSFQPFSFFPALKQFTASTEGLWGHEQSTGFRDGGRLSSTSSLLSHLAGPASFYRTLETPGPTLSF